jgi:transposase
MLKHRIHSTLITFGHPCPGDGPVRRRRPAAARPAGDPTALAGTVDASLKLIEDLERQIDQINRDGRASGADQPYVPLLLSVPGIGWVSRCSRRLGRATISCEREPCP